MDYVRSDKSGDGAACWSGTKVLCRTRPQSPNDMIEVWIGTAPACAASSEDCASVGLSFVRADASGDGATCTSGTKVLCRGPRSSYRPDMQASGGRITNIQQPNDGAVVRVQSVNFPQNFFQVRGSLVYIDPIPQQLADGTRLTGDPRFEFDMIRGLADAGGVSFRSRTQQNHYLRHSNYTLVSAPNDGSDLFAKDATFREVPGLSGTGSSFESVNFPGYFLRHSNYQVFLHQNDGSSPFRQDASFVIQRYTVRPGQ